MKETKQHLTDLGVLITKQQDEINAYLSEVPAEQFKKDVLSLISRSSDKELIKSTIKKLQEIIEE